MGQAMEAYTWLIILAAGSLLFLIGLSGGDPLTARQPGKEVPATALAMWFKRRWETRREAAAMPAAGAVTRATESGLHAVA